MLGELPEQQEDVVFSPNREDVITIVNGVNEMLSEEPYKDMRVLDIIAALDAMGAFLRETIGIAGMTNIVED